MHLNRSIDEQLLSNPFFLYNTVSCSYIVGGCVLCPALSGQIRDEMRGKSLFCSFFINLSAWSG